MNMKVRRVDITPHVRTVVFRLSSWRVSGFPESINTLLRTFPPSPRKRLWRTCRTPLEVRRRGAVATHKVATVRTARNRAVCQRANSAVSRRTVELYQNAATAIKRGAAKKPSRQFYCFVSLPFISASQSESYNSIVGNSGGIKSEGRFKLSIICGILSLRGPKSFCTVLHTRR